LVPGKPQRLFDEPANFEIPFRRIELRHASVVQDGPFDRERLSGRKTAFGASLFSFARRPPSSPKIGMRITSRY
jgi:hypothetical protein